MWQGPEPWVLHSRLLKELQHILICVAAIHVLADWLFNIFHDINILLSASSIFIDFKIFLSGNIIGGVGIFSEQTGFQWFQDFYHIYVCNINICQCW